jgi:transposase
MRLTRTDEFRKDAVRIALTSGLTRKQVADDLGVGMSTLNKWITAHRDTDVVSKEDLGLKRMTGFDVRTASSRRSGTSQKATQFFVGLKQ